MSFWIYEEGQVVGPLDANEVRRRSKPETLVSYGQEWVRFDEHPDLAHGDRRLQITEHAERRGTSGTQVALVVGLFLTQLLLFQVSGHIAQQNYQNPGTFSEDLASAVNLVGAVAWFGAWIVAAVLGFQKDRPLFGMFIGVLGLFGLGIMLVVRPKWTCPSCDHQIAKNSQVCTACGVDLDPRLR